MLVCFLLIDSDNFDDDFLFSHYMENFFVFAIERTSSTTIANKVLRLNC
jgi:hypothetical protein